MDKVSKMFKALNANERVVVLQQLNKKGGFLVDGEDLLLIMESIKNKKEIIDEKTN